VYSTNIDLFSSFIDTITLLVINLIKPNANALNNTEFLQQSNNLSQKHFFRDSQLAYLNWLHEAAPCFPVNGNKISVISEPKDFYNAVLERAKSARFRILLASLYLGIGQLETELVKSIEQNVRSNKDLSVNILLDYTRGTRGQVNSKSILMPLIQQSQNCNLSLYHTPVLRGITKKLAPARWNELLGIQHMKLYLFDNTVIISGANLSQDYFTNRQDRYVMIEDQRLANFFSDLVGKVQEFSMNVEPNGDVKLHDTWKLLPYESSQRDFADEAKKRIRGFFNETYEKQRLICDEDTGE